ncbi:hypothetical protein EV424DRAFT_1367034, partial [Suillus variegatus]
MHEIYERVHAEFPGAGLNPAKAVPLPPKLDHAIRSVKYLKKTVLEEMAAAREIEEVHIKRGQLHEDGTRDLSIVSKAYGKTEITSDSNKSMSNVWHWRLTPDYETKIYNYSKPPIEKILWKPGEQEARRRARGSVDS